MISLALPVAQPRHAGGRYVQALVEALEGRCDLVVLSPDGPANRAAAAAGGTPRRFALLGDARLSSGWERWGYRAVHRLQPLLHRIDRSAPYLPMLYDLRHVPALRDLVRSADVIDLQWPDYAKLAPHLRRLNPTARIISTFHDVLTQRYERAGSQARGRPRADARFQAGVQRVLEPRAANASDVAICFSDKDADLLRNLGAHGEVRVVDPPLAGPVAPSWNPPTRPRVTFVSYLAREENHDAALWLVREIWPRVASRVPSATLRLVGGGAKPALLEAVETAERVECVGFVDDLDPEYGYASAVVVPLRRGAGVKFKVIEGLLAGVPVVTTFVGAEGIGGDELFAGLTDDAQQFADAVCEALVAPDVESARKAQSWAHHRYGIDHFRETVRELYLGQHVANPRQGAVDPSVSVVVPVHNGGDDLLAQLDLLLAEPVDGVEILVVDNNSTDDTAHRVRALSERDPRVFLVPGSGRPGVAVARNKGVAVARGRNILFCDCDDLIEPGWIEAMVEGLRRYDMVGGRVETAHINSARTLSWHGGALVQSELPIAAKYLPYATGANMGVRRAVFDKVGYFDEWFERGHEEVDFAWRVQRAGFTLGFVPSAVVHYRLRSTLDGLVKQRFWYASSAAQLDLRYGADVGRPGLRKNLRWLFHLLRGSRRVLSRVECVPWLLDVAWTLGHTRGLLRHRKAGS